MKSAVRFTFEGDIAAQVAAFAKKVQEEATRPAARAMALVLYAEMRERVPYRLGALQASIYHYFDSTASRDGRMTYLVGPNKRKAPHWHLVEYGFWRRYKVHMLPDGSFVTLTKSPLAAPVFQPGTPYIRPAYDAKIAEAGQAGLRRMAEKIQEIRGA